MKKIKYERQKVLEYASKWALARNPVYYNFDNVGGDCTSFASQCIHAGSKIMNYNINNGWYYIDGNRKSPSWSGVEFLYNFLINNKSVGPYGINVAQPNIEIGDIAQLSFNGKTFGHTLVIINIQNPNNLENIYVATHTIDSYNKPISEYTFKKIRFIHINGVKMY